MSGRVGCSLSESAASEDRAGQLPEPPIPRGALGESALPSFFIDECPARLTFTSMRIKAFNTGCAAAWAGVWLLLAPALPAADWPMFRGRPALTGVAQETLPPKLSLLWTFKTAGAVKSSAALVQGRAFIGSDDGNLYALDLASGKRLWAFKTGGEVESSPLVLAGKVFVGASDGWLYAVDAATGKQAWKYETGDKILGSPNWVQPGENALVNTAPPAGTTLNNTPPQPASPLINTPLERGERSTPGSSNRFNGFSGAAKTVETVQPPVSGTPDTSLKQGVNEKGKESSRPTGQPKPAGSPRILIGSYDFKLHCVDAATGQSNWVYETGNYINGAPAVAAGQAVFAGCDGLLHVIALASGQQEKEIEAGAYVPGSAALVDHRAYLGHYEGQFLCIDLAAGKKAWAFKGRNAAFVASPAVTADRVIFGGQDKLLHCLKREDGSPLWTFATRGKVDSSPVVCNDNVIVGSDDGRLYLVSLDKGKELWSYDLGQPIKSSPAVAGGKVVIGSDDGNIYCFGAK
jgi:eukaryotic-like serine/threonine-protein kinase